MNEKNSLFNVLLDFQSEDDQLPFVDLSLRITEVDHQLKCVLVYDKDLFETVHPDESDDRLTNQMMIKEADIYIYAHIHKPYIKGGLSIREVLAFDVDQVIQQFQESDYPNIKFMTEILENKE